MDQMEFLSFALVLDEVFVLGTVFHFLDHAVVDHGLDEVLVALVCERGEVMQLMMPLLASREREQSAVVAALVAASESVP